MRHRLLKIAPECSEGALLLWHSPEHHENPSLFSLHVLVEVLSSFSSVMCSLWAGVYLPVTGKKKGSGKGAPTWSISLDHVVVVPSLFLGCRACLFRQMVKFLAGRS